MNNKPADSPFKVRDCTLVLLSTGKHAQNLREFRDCLNTVHQDSIYHHFWGRLLQPKFDEPEYLNDFASWANHGLHDKALAERLSVIDPTAIEDIEALRAEVLETVESRLDEKQFVSWASADAQFHFIRSQLIVLDTGREFKTPATLGKAITKMSNGSIYYHFIDAKRRSDNGCSDFSNWLLKFRDDHKDKIEDLCALDPYFSSLRWLKHRIAGILNGNGGGLIDE